MIWLRVCLLLGNSLVLSLFLPGVALADNCSGPGDCSVGPNTGLLGGLGVGLLSGVWGGWLGRAIEYGTPVGWLSHTYGFFTGRMPFSGDKVWFDWETATNLPGELWDDFSRGHARDRLYAFGDQLNPWGDHPGGSYWKALEGLGHQLKVAGDFYTSGRVMEGLTETPLLETAAQGLEAKARDLAAKAVAADGGVQFARDVADLTADLQVQTLAGEGAAAGLTRAAGAAGLVPKAAGAAGEAGAAAGETARALEQGGRGVGETSRALEQGATGVGERGAGSAGRTAEGAGGAPRAPGGEAPRATSEATGPHGTERLQPGEVRSAGPETGPHGTQRLQPGEVREAMEGTGPHGTQRLQPGDTPGQSGAPGAQPGKITGPEATAPTVRTGPEATAPTVRTGPEATAPTVRTGPEAEAPTVRMPPPEPPGTPPGVRGPSEPPAQTPWSENPTWRGNPETPGQPGQGTGPTGTQGYGPGEGPGMRPSPADPGSRGGFGEHPGGPGQPPADGPFGPPDPNKTVRMGEWQEPPVRGEGAENYSQFDATSDYVNMTSAERNLTESTGAPRSASEQAHWENQYQKSVDNIMEGMRNDPNYLEHYSGYSPDELGQLRDHLGQAGASPADLNYLDDMINQAGGRSAPPAPPAPPASPAPPAGPSAQPGSSVPTPLPPQTDSQKP